MKRFIAAALLVTGFGAISVAPAPASACMNSMERFEENPQVDTVDRAWTWIESKRYDDAVEILTTEWDDFVPGEFDADKANKQTALQRRALRAIAISHVRANHSENLEWARDVLKSLSKEGKGADGVSAHYAEALIATGNATDGRVLLEELAKRNGISDAFGWRLLSDLRKADGDKAGAEQALAKATTLEKKGTAKARSRAVKSKKRRSKKKSKTISFDQLYN